MDRQKPPLSQRKPQPKTPGRRWLRYLILAIAVVILAPIAAACVFIARFDPNKYAPQIAAAMQDATGRTLTIGAPIHLQLSLTPSLAASNLSLSNPPGFTSPALLTLDKVEAQIALLPLLRHQLDILDLKLEGPKLYLERNAAGQADWNFTPQPAQNGQAAPNTAKQQAKNGGKYKIALEAVDLENGQIIIQGQPGQSASPNGNLGAQPLNPPPPQIIQLSQLTGKADSLTSPLQLSGAAAIGNAPLTLSGMVGPVSRLTGTGSSPWPVDLSFGFAGATGKLQGKLTKPQNASGYDLAFTAAIPALEAIGAALPPNWLGGLTLPPLHNVTAAAQITDQQSPLPALTNISVKAGPSDLSSLRAGLSLAALDFELPSLTKSGTLSANGALSVPQGQLPFVIQANISAPSAFIPPALLPASAPPPGNFSESLNASLGAASLSLTGGIATPRTLSGAALALTLNIPDLAALSPAAGQSLPAWKNIAVKTTLIDPGGQGLTQAIGFDSLSATMDNASFGGDASLTLKPAKELDLDLSIAQANLDALIAAIPAAPAPAGNTAGGQAASPAQTPGRLIPNATLPLDLLRHSSADILLRADSLTYNKATYSAVQGHAVLNNAKLTINPLSGQLPGGAVSASGSIDANVDPAAETLKLNAPALALSPFLHAFNLPDIAQGTVQAQLNATSKGNALPDMAASVSGQLGLASVNGVVDGSVINHIFGAALGAVGLPAGLAGAPGPVAMRCAALRLDAQNGTGIVKALTIDSSRLFMQGGGTVNFATETLGLVLKPRLDVKATDVTVPIEVNGSFIAPSYRIAPDSAVTSAAQAAIGLAGNPVQDIVGSNTLLGKAIGLVTGNEGDACPAALSLARMGQPGPAAPAQSSQPASGGSQPVNSPRSLLNSLLGK